MKLSKWFRQQPPAWIFAEMIAILIAIGFLDLVTGSEIRLLPLYGGAIFAVAWFCDKRVVFPVALLSGLIWWLANRPDLHNWIDAWEVARHLGFFLVVAWVGTVLRTKSEMDAARIALLEHSQQLERQIVKITDAEQRRIGQDLHDGLCQYLAALSCSATSLRDDLAKLGLKAEAAAARELGELLQEAVIQTRDLAKDLVPAHLENVGLVAALESLASTVSHLQRINCTFVAEDKARRYEDPVARHLYRIAQEALNNATKHGKARNIAISLGTSNGLTKLKIEDDGIGISPSAALNESGMGINIMRYRARLSGGELGIEQPPNGGTVIWCTAKTDGIPGENSAE